MPVQNEAKRALLHSRVLSGSLFKYLENHDLCPVHTLVDNLRESQRANHQLLEAIIRSYHLNRKLIDFTEESENVLRTRTSSH